MQTLSNAEEGGDLRELELLAQLHYRYAWFYFAFARFFLSRAQKYADCARVYQRLVNDYHDESDNERLVNYLAVQVNCQLFSLPFRSRKN